MTTSTARVIAPVALIVMAMAVAVVIIASIDGSNEGSDSGSSGAAPGCTTAAEQAVEDGYYVLEEGESLADVADKTCVEVNQIERLNPNLDPRALPSQGCVDLVKDGCKVLAAQG